MSATKFSYDKSKIMRQAWTIYRSLRGVASFSTALRNAWRLVKMQLRKQLMLPGKRRLVWSWRRANPPLLKPWLGCAKP